MAYGELKSVGLAQSVVEIVVTAPASGGLLDQGPYRWGMSELEARAAQLPRVRNTLSEGQLLQRADEAINGPASFLALARVSRRSGGPVARRRPRALGSRNSTTIRPRTGGTVESSC